MQWKIDSWQSIDEAMRDSVLDRIEEGKFCLDDMKDYFTVFSDDTWLQTERHPVWRRRELDSGFHVQRGNLSLR